LAYSDEYWYSEDLKLATIPLRRGYAQASSYRGLWSTVQRMWQDVAARINGGEIDFDYMAISGDDALWIVENLREYLSQLLVLNQTEYLGGVDPYRRNSAFPWVGGAGYVVSKDLIIERKLEKCNQTVKTLIVSGEDVMTSKCLFSQGVVARDTRDASGGIRFCRNRPDKPCELSRPGFPSGSPSRQPVLFHYMHGAARIAAHNRLYECHGFSGDPINVT